MLGYFDGEIAVVVVDVPVVEFDEFVEECLKFMLFEDGVVEKFCEDEDNKG